MDAGTCRVRSTHYYVLAVESEDPDLSAHYRPVAREYRAMADTLDRLALQSALPEGPTLVGPAHFGVTTPAPLPKPTSNVLSVSFRSLGQGLADARKTSDNRITNKGGGQ